MNNVWSTIVIKLIGGTSYTIIIITVWFLTTSTILVISGNTQDLQYNSLLFSESHQSSRCPLSWHPLVMFSSKPLMVCLYLFYLLFLIVCHSSFYLSFLIVCLSSFYLLPVVSQLRACFTICWLFLLITWSKHANSFLNKLQLLLVSCAFILFMHYLSISSIGSI